MSKITWRYFKIGFFIVSALFAFGWGLHFLLKMELGSVADFVGGFGAIAAILSVGWQTSVQAAREEEKRKLDSRPFKVNLGYRSGRIDKKSIFIYSSQYAASKINSEPTEKIKSIISQCLNKQIGFIRFRVIGDLSIYEVMITLQASGRSESIQIPFVKAGVDYIWLTGSSLDKIDYLEKQTITKSRAFD